MMETEFLEDFSQSLFPEKVNGDADKYRCFFRLRFDGKNYDLENKNSKCDNILSLMEKENFYHSDIQRTQKTVIEEIVNQYKLELESDKQDSHSWINVGPGQRGIWKQVYNWLWKYKFPRWELDRRFWEPLKHKTTGLDWIKILSKIDERNLEIPVIEPETLLVDEPLWISIQLPLEYDYLLLLYRGLTQQCFLCPSYIFAPEYQLSENKILIPQMESFWYQKNKDGMKLTTPGNQEFVAIALKEVLDFDWLKPRQEEPVVGWTSDRLTQLWQWLDDNPNSWQGCYQKFAVA